MSENPEPKSDRAEPAEPATERDELESEPAAEPVSASSRERLFRFIPALDSARHYSWRALRSDLLAGLTVAAVAVPQAMAYASIFGVPVEYGLYTAMVMTAVGAIFDSSKQLINGPTNAISIALLSALASPHITTDAEKIAAAVLMALLVGAIQTTITLFRLGDLSRFISHAVIVGFTVGASVLLVLDQFKNLLGLIAHGGPEDHFLKRFCITLTEGGPTHGWTIGLGLGSMLLAMGLLWFSRRLRFPLPAFLIVVIVAAALVQCFDLDKSGVRVVGDIPRKLPSFEFPQVKWPLVRELGGSALAIAVLGLLEAIAMAKGIAAQTGQKLDINQQCLSEGVANLVGSFFQCFPGSGSLTRSAINQQAGAATQWSGVISAAAVAVTVLLLAPFARYVPRAALAGILMISAWRMVDRRQLLYHWRATRFDAGIMIATAVAAVAVSVEFCILIGTFLSFVFYVPRAARVHLTPLAVTPERVIRERIHTDARCNRLAIYSLEGELFFGSAPDLERHLASIERRLADGVRVIVLRVKNARNPDASCIAIIDGFLSRMESRGVPVILCGIRHDMARVLRNTGLDVRIGAKRLFREDFATRSSTLDAVRYAYELLGDDVCETCPRRQEKVGQAADWYYMI